MVTKKGDGPEVLQGDIVGVMYKGMLKNGKEFDASGNEPLNFQVGKSEVIKAWDQGLVGLKGGDKATITAPPEFAYGDQEIGGGLIPANSTLVFEVEIVKIARF